MTSQYTDQGLERRRRKLLSLVEPGRLERAQRVQLINPRRQGAALVGIAKSSDGKTRYVARVHLDTLETVCNCADRKYRTQFCKHVAAVLRTFELDQEAAA